MLCRFAVVCSCTTRLWPIILELWKIRADLSHESLVVRVAGDTLEKEGHGGVLQSSPLLGAESSCLARRGQGEA